MYMHSVDPTIPFEFSRLLPGMPHNYSMIDDPVINEAHEAIAAAEEPEKSELMKAIVPYILEQGYILVPPVPYTKTTVHEPMTGQKLVGQGSFSPMPPGILASSSFTFTNPDCVSEITIERLSIIRGNGEVIYEGPMLRRDGTLGPYLMKLKPHATRFVILSTYVPAGFPGWYTAEVFWTWTDEEGLPLIGWGETHYYVDNEIVESKRMEELCNSMIVKYTDLTKRRLNELLTSSRYSAVAMAKGATSNSSFGQTPALGHAATLRTVLPPPPRAERPTSSSPSKTSGVFSISTL